MISEALRYYSICKKIKKHLPRGGTILDVGSKGRGIGLIYPHPFTGVDLSFPKRIQSKMAPIAGSVLNLPFLDKSYDLVVCSDVLEHIAPADRPAAVLELIRVARQTLILGFPAGEEARATDLFTDRLFKAQGKKRPDWLEDHLKNGPVDPEQVEEVLQGVRGARADFIENQSVRFGFFLAKIESRRIFKAFASLLCHLMPSLVGAVVSRFFDKPPPYARRIYAIHLTEK